MSNMDCFPKVGEDLGFVDPEMYPIFFFFKGKKSVNIKSSLEC